MNTERKILSTSDIQRLLGVSVRTSQRRMRELKMAYGKQNHQLITCTEFVNYYDLKL